MPSKRFQRPAATWIAAFFLLLSLPAHAAAVGDTENAAPSSEAGQALPLQQAITRLCEQLNARIVVMGTLGPERVVLNLASRSALENLKSILKNYSYAVVYNDSSPACDSIDMPERTEGEGRRTVSMGSHLDETSSPERVGHKERLAARIERLEAQIESGEADKFLSRWRKHKDPKYIFNHRSELERLRNRLAKLDSR